MPSVVPQSTGRPPTGHNEVRFVPEDRRRASEGQRLPAVPESVLGPFFQWAGEALREFKAQDIPPALRPLLGFDRRGFSRAAARAQLRKALETDPAFLSDVLEALAGRPEVEAVLKDWDPGRALVSAREADARDDLPLLASALAVARPEGWELGLGVAAALHDRGREERSAEDDRRAFDTQVAKAQEAQRRAEGEVARLRGEVERLAGELRDERAARREREEAVRAEAEEPRRRVTELEALLAEARHEAARSDERALREADRAAELEARLQRFREDAARARAKAEQAAAAPADESTEPMPAVPEAIEDAHAASPEPAPPEPPRPVLTRRVRVELPAGVVGPSVEGLRGAMSLGDPAVVVDGYNVSMLAWGDEPPDSQRQRLCAALERLHLRTNRAVTVVFDGADVEGVRPPRRPGVRVLFSAPGQEADDVVVQQVRSLPLERPVIAVSSDRRVRDETEAAGALSVPADVFLEFLRK